MVTVAVMDHSLKPAEPVESNKRPAMQAVFGLRPAAKRLLGSSLESDARNVSAFWKPITRECGDLLALRIKHDDARRAEQLKAFQHGLVVGVIGRHVDLQQHRLPNLSRTAGATKVSFSISLHDTHQSA